MSDPALVGAQGARAPVPDVELGPLLVPRAQQRNPLPLPLVCGCAGVVMGLLLVFIAPGQRTIALSQAAPVRAQTANNAVVSPNRLNRPAVGGRPQVPETHRSAPPRSVYRVPVSEGARPALHSGVGGPWGGRAVLGAVAFSIAAAVGWLWSVRATRSRSLDAAPPAPARLALMSASGAKEEGEGATGPWSRRNVLLGAGAAGLVANKIGVEGPSVFTPADGTLKGRTILITGGNHGLGKEAAVRLAKGGARVVITARSAAKGQAALEEIKAESGSDDIGFLVLDLADLQSVRDCAAAFDRDYGALTVLMNNAGVMAIPERQETKDGFEKQFGINHLGHFALTALLQGALRRGAEGGRAARVINVSSSASYGADAKAFDFDGPGGLMGPENYTQWGAYCQSKLANVMFTKELDERYKAAGVPITAVALHPGAVRTELARYLISGKDELLANSQLSIPSLAFLPIGVYFTKAVDRGANSQVWLAAGADGAGTYDQSGGEFFQNLKPLPVNPVANDRALRDRLWTESERLTNTPFQV